MTCRQVVAGIKYTLVMGLSDGTEHTLSIVDQPWMDTRYSMISDELTRSP